MSLPDLGVVLLLVAGMLALGTVLEPTAVRERLRSPGPLGVALAANLLVVPAAGLLAVRVVDLPPAVGLGLVLAAVCPGGGTGALLALQARGDVAHAVLLQGALAAASLVATPLWLLAAAGEGTVARVAVAPLVLGLLTLQLGPLLLGSVSRARRPGAAARVHAVARRVADVTLAAVVVGLLVLHVGELGELGVRALAVAAALVAVSLAVGLVPAGSRTVRVSATTTTAVRNLSLALLAATLAPDPGLTSLAVLAYGLVMYALGLAAVLVLRRGAVTPALR